MINIIIMLVRTVTWVVSLLGLMLAGLVWATEQSSVITVTASEGKVLPVRGFVANNATTATKTTTALLETPQSITVITPDRIRLQGAQSVQQMLNYTAGARGDTYGVDNRNDSAIIRGASATQYLDGLLNDIGYYNNTRPDPYALERAEILRGPSAMLYGQGAIGGVVNLVSKHPQPEAAHEIGVNFGNYHRKQIQADSTGPLDRQGKWLYRLVAMARDSGSPVDYARDNRYLIAPSLTWRPDENTSLTLLGNLQKDDSNGTVGFFPWRGTLTETSLGRIPQHFFVSEPDFDKFVTQQAAVGYQFRHSFSGNFTLRQNLRYSYSKVDYRNIYTKGRRSKNEDRGWLAGSDTKLARVLYLKQSTLNQLAVDTQGQLTFSSGSLWHTLLAGIDYQYSTLASAEGKGGSAEPIDVYHPVYGNYTAPGSIVKNATSLSRQVGFYLQDQIEWNNWLFSAGLRYDHSAISVQNTPSATRNDNELSKRAGLMYRTDAGIHPYISYNESFEGVSGFNKSGTPFKPLYGKQWETGVKYQPPGKNMVFSASVFDMREKNRKMAGIVNGIDDQVQVGEARTRGVELETMASLDQLDLLVAYTYLDAKIIKGNPAEQGNQLSKIPVNMASLWLNYHFTLFNISGFTAGGGVRYNGHSHDGTGNNRVGSVTLYDVLLAWDDGKVRVALNVDNLFDRQYVASCIARGDCFFGTRRSIIGNITWRF